MQKCLVLKEWYIYNVLLKSDIKKFAFFLAHDTRKHLIFFTIIELHNWIKIISSRHLLFLYNYRTRFTVWNLSSTHTNKSRLVDSSVPTKVKVTFWALSCFRALIDHIKQRTQVNSNNKNQSFIFIKLKLVL